MKKEMQAIDKAVTRINLICASLAGLILLFITFTIFIDVFLRYFFNSPSVWITEVSSYLFLYVVFLGTSYALQADLHISVTFLSDQFGKGLGYIVGLFRILLSALFSAVLLWQTSRMTWKAFSENWTTPTMLSVPYALIYVAMVIGSALLLITLINRFILQLLQMRID